MPNLALKKNVYEWPMTTQMLVMGLICLAVFYFGYRWDLLSLKSQLASSQQQEEDIKQQLELVIKKQLAVKDEILKFTSLQDMLAQWQKKLSNYSDLPEVLDEILKIGGNNHLHFSLFNPGVETQVNSYFKVPIKVIATGSYHQLGDFISQIANMQWIVVVNNMTISKENKNDVLGAKIAEQANAENLLTGEFTLEVYHIAKKNGQ